MNENLSISFKPQKPHINDTTNQMEGALSDVWARRLQTFLAFLRIFLFKILSQGSIPNHIAFIMDGNRRYAKKHNLPYGAGHRAGFLALLSLLKYCAELGVKYISLYAFSIDNYRRKPDEVQIIMDLIQEKTEALLEQVDILNEYGVRLVFLGNLKLLREPIRAAARETMATTRNNTNMVILICVAYNSSDEILRAIQESCKQKHYDGPFEDVIKGDGSMKQLVTLDEIEKCMDMSVAPNPDILVRTSGENRLSNFLIWQAANCMLYSPAALWPEIGLWHLVWAVLNYQRLKPKIGGRNKQA